MFWVTKHRATLSDADGAVFPRPIIDVLKQMMVDGAAVGWVELAVWKGFQGSQREHRNFKFFKLDSRRYPLLVEQNGTALMAIGIVKIGVASQISSRISGLHIRDKCFADLIYGKPLASQRINATAISR